MEADSFSTQLVQALIAVWEGFVREHGHEEPYAFTLIGNPRSPWFGYAVATKGGLDRVVSKYAERGYTCGILARNSPQSRAQLSICFRWANPDDGWHQSEFPKEFSIRESLSQLVQANVIDPEHFEEFCIEILLALRQTPEWQPWSEKAALGFTYGEDPRDFLRIATRVNSYPLVRRLWGEFQHGEMLAGQMVQRK